MRGNIFFTGFFIFTIHVITSSVCFGQTDKYANFKQRNSKVKNLQYVPKTVVVKFKPDFRHLSQNHKLLESISSISEDMRKCKAISLSKLLKNATAPSKSHNDRGEAMVDLSLVSIFTYQADIPVEDVIAAFYRSGLVEYAEPKYIPKYELNYMPNDRYAQKDSAQALLFERHNAYWAWNISKGDTNIVIGILDTGTDFTHSDLAGNVKYNYADPPGGGDNDGDGYTDNFRGWDFGTSDNNPTYTGGLDHGVCVQGVSSAITDNTTGVAGTGFKCKTLPLKISDSFGNLPGGYAAIVYAADHGCKVINCSWGGETYSLTEQQVVNYAAINKDVLIVASAGNYLNADIDYYPASYDNVLSVTGLDVRFGTTVDTIEVRGTFGVGSGNIYSFNVDVGALNGGFSTSKIGYKAFAGTSFAAPVVSGAAGLIRSKYPLLKAAQVAELIRVTGSIIDTFPETFPESRYKTGRKLDMYKALTNMTTPSVRMKSYSAKSVYSDSTFFSGDTLIITNQFFNYLSKANNVSIKLRCINGFAKVIDSISILGMIDSLTGKSNTSDPFKIIVNTDSLDKKIELVMFYTDNSKNYYDFQGFKIPINPSYITIDTNKVSLTIGSNSRLGYNNYSVYTSPYHFDGVGFNYGSYDLLFGSGLMIGIDASRVSDCQFGATAPDYYDNDFKIQKNLRYYPSTIKDVETKSTYNDSLATNKIGVSIEQRSYAWKNAPNDKFIIIEYQIKNNRPTPIDSLYAGIYADWDVDPLNGDASFYLNNRADWDDEDKIGYAYHSDFGSKYAGMALLTNGAPSCFSIDNSNVGGNNINVTDGFSTTEKYKALSSGIYRKQAGTSGTGNDISQVVSSQLKNIAPGEVRTVAFAFIAGDNLLDLKATAKAAKAKFISIKTGPIPVIANQHICAKDIINITVTPSNGTNFNFYDTLNSNNPNYQGATYTLNNVSAADTIYIANNDSLFLSNSVPFIVSKDNMLADFYLLPDTLNLAKNQTVYFVNQSLNTSSIFWDFGDGNSTSGSVVKHDYAVAGIYDVKLKTTSATCVDSITKKLVVIGTIGPDTILVPTNIDEALLQGVIKVYPNPVGNSLNIDLSSESYQGLNISIFDALGKEIYSTTANSQNININMASQPSGVYYLKLKSEKSVSTKKFLKY